MNYSALWEEGGGRPGSWAGGLLPTAQGTPSWGWDQRACPPPPAPAVALAKQLHAARLALAHASLVCAILRRIDGPGNDDLGARG